MGYQHERALDAASGAPGRLRALPDSFMEVEQSLIVNTGERAKLDALARFVDEIRASGFIKAAIDRAKVAGVDGDMRAGIGRLTGVQARLVHCWSDLPRGGPYEATHTALLVDVSAPSHNA
jgi:hypothetical protein